MSVYPCTVCHQRRPGKLATAYWAWFKVDGSRIAYKSRYCVVCAQSELSSLLQSLRRAGTSTDVFACVMCGASAEGDSDPTYLTLYLPSREPEEFALQLDGACAAKLRIQIIGQSELLPDRGGLVRGPSPSTYAWDELGLSPA